MRRVLTGAMLFMVWACSDEPGASVLDYPGPPRPGPGPMAYVWGMVIEESGICIPGATVRVVEGQSLDVSAAQETPCDAWSEIGGFYLRDLVPGVSMTIRATAPGYLTLDRTIVPSLGPQMAFTFQPTRER